MSAEQENALLLAKSIDVLETHDISTDSNPPNILESNSDLSNNKL